MNKSKTHKAHKSHLPLCHYYGLQVLSTLKREESVTVNLSLPGEE